MYLPFAAIILAGLCIVVALFGTASWLRRAILTLLAVHLTIFAFIPIDIRSTLTTASGDILFSIAIAGIIVVLALAWAAVSIWATHRKHKPWPVSLLAFAIAGGLIALIYQSSP